MDDRSLNMKRVEMASDPLVTNSGTCEEWDLIYSTKKPKISSDANSGEYEDGRDSNIARSNYLTARSGSSEYLLIYPDDVDDEVLQHRHSLRAGKSRRKVGDKCNAQRKDRYDGEVGRQNTAMVKERFVFFFFSRRGGHANLSLHWHGKTGSADWWKESDISEGTGNGRDEDCHGRKARHEDPRKRVYSLEFSSRNQDKPRGRERSEKDDHHQPAGQ